MPYQRKITAKTDASTTQGCGVGVSFVCEIYDNHGIKEEYKENKYIERKVSTTDAECLSIIFAAKKIHEIFQGKEDCIKNYKVVIQNDCEHAIERVNHDKYDKEIDKFINYYNSRFGGIEARWIPRTANQKADALAREIYRKGDEGEL